MIHEAYMPVYMGSRFSLRTGARAGPPEVVQEALADLKMPSLLKSIPKQHFESSFQGYPTRFW